MSGLETNEEQESEEGEHNVSNIYSSIDTHNVVTMALLCLKQIKLVCEFYFLLLKLY